MNRRRAIAAGIETKIGNHTFRATGITAYLENDGALEKAAAIADALLRRRSLFAKGMPCFDTPRERSSNDP